MATAEENKATIWRATEAFNNLEREKWDACFADPCLFHFRTGDRTISHDEHWNTVLGIFKVFPDLKATIDGLIAEDDRVFVQVWQLHDPAYHRPHVDAHPPR